MAALQGWIQIGNGFYNLATISAVIVDKNDGSVTVHLYARPVLLVGDEAKAFMEKFTKALEGLNL